MPLPFDFYVNSQYLIEYDVNINIEYGHDGRTILFDACSSE